MHPIAHCVAIARRERISGDDASDDEYDEYDEYDESDMKDHMRMLESYLASHGYEIEDLRVDWLAASVLRHIDELGRYSDATGCLMSERTAADADAEAALAGLPCPEAIAGRHDIRSTDFRCYLSGYRTNGPQQRQQRQHRRPPQETDSP
jgi:hypothetical protein